MKKLLLVLLACVVLSGCATSSGINQLRIGMSSSEVKKTLGTPKSINSSSNTTIWKYELFQPFVGWMPYYLEFNSTDQLTSYKADEDEYQRNQQANQQALMGVAQQMNDANLQRQQQQQLIQQQAQQEQLMTQQKTVLQLQEAELRQRKVERMTQPFQATQSSLPKTATTTVRRDLYGNVTGWDTQER